MSSFTTPLEITPAPELGALDWLTCRDLVVWIGKAATVAELVFVIPAATRTDLGSIPRWLWWLLSPHDARFAPLFVAHDHACRVLPRIVADALIIDLGFVLARKHRAGLWRPVLMYAGVRAYVVARALCRAARPLTL